MPQSDYDKYLYDTFKRFFGAWASHIDSYEHDSDYTIKVKMQKGDFVNSGYTYIFGDNGCDDWHLETIKHPASIRV